MKILLKKILEKVTLVIFCLVVIFGNILLIYNFNNKFQNINELYEFSDKIDNSNYICIKNIDNEKVIEINSDEDKQKLKEFFNKIRVRESKLKLIDKEQKIDYTIYIYTSDAQIFVNINDSEIMINNEIYETDIKIDTYLKEFFEI